MDKLNLLVSTGKLEVVFKDNELLLNEIHELQKYVFENEPLKVAVILGRLNKMTENIEYDCTTELNSIYDSLLDSKIRANHLPYSVNKNLNIEELDLSVRAFNCLKRANICTINDIADMSLEDLMKVRNLGKQCFEEVVDKMHSYGIILKESDE